MHSDFYAAVVVISVPLVFLADQRRRDNDPSTRQPAEIAVAAAAVVAIISSAYSLFAQDDPVWLRLSALVSMSVALVTALGLYLWPARDRLAASTDTSRLSRFFRIAVVPLAIAGAAAIGRWFPASTTAPFLAGYRRQQFTVEGTCVNEACGLRQHTFPEADAPTRGKLLQDGERIELICQRFGGNVKSHTGRQSQLWDLLPNRLWVSDLYVTTSKRGLRSTELPACPPISDGGANQNASNGSHA